MGLFAEPETAVAAAALQAELERERDEAEEELNDLRVLKQTFERTRVDWVSEGVLRRPR